MRAQFRQGPGAVWRVRPQVKLVPTGWKISGNSNVRGDNWLTPQVLRWPNIFRVRSVLLQILQVVVIFLHVFTKLIRNPRSWRPSRARSNLDQPFRVEIEMAGQAPGRWLVYADVSNCPNTGGWD